MKLNALMAACVVLLLATSTAGQDRPAAADPISGSWGSDGQPLLELKFDGKSTVTGTTIWRDGGREITRAPIKTGTFIPKTGAFRLEGEARNPRDGATVRYVIEGKVENATATGSYELGGQKGEFTFKKLS